MRTMRPVHDEECSVACTAEIIGSKWTAIIVHDLSEGPRRFSELERSCPGISPRTLSERLRALEQGGIIERRSGPPAGRLRLTAKGEGAPADHQRDAPLRPRVARAGARALARTSRGRRCQPVSASAAGRAKARSSRAPPRLPAARSGRGGARSASGCCRPGIAKPVRIVGMPLSASAGTIGRVPPLRSSSGRLPSTRSKASRASCTAGASAGISPAGADDQRSISSSAPVGAASRRRRSNAARDGLDVLPRREPDGDVGLGSGREHGLLQVGLAALDPVDVDGRLGERARVELLGGMLVLRLARRRRRARRRRDPARPTRSAPRRWAGRHPPRSSSGTATTASSVCISACTALRAAPP